MQIDVFKNKMSSTVLGHAMPGIGFFLIGLWHLFNHTKLHILHPLSYTAPPWFPVQNLRYAEPVFITAGSTVFILEELFISPRRHQPLDPDGSIPSSHLRNLEHASIGLALLVYASFAIVTDKICPKMSGHLTYFLASVAFGQQLLLFGFHSADHVGPEGRYHLFLELLAFSSLTTLLMGIGFPNSFVVSFLRSMSIIFQGVWFVATGVMLWTPEFLPKGCFLHNEGGRKVARCSGEESLRRAKSLINLEFSLFLTITAVFGVSFYLVLVKIYGGQEVEYSSLRRREEKDEDFDGDVESQKKSIMFGNS